MHHVTETRLVQVLDALLRASKVLAGRLPEGRVTHLTVTTVPATTTSTFSDIAEAVRFIVDGCTGHIDIYENSDGIVMSCEKSSGYAVYFIRKDSVAFEHEKTISKEKVIGVIEDIILDEAMKAKPREIPVPRDEETRVEKILGEHADEVRRALIEWLKRERFIEFPVPYKRKDGYRVSYAHTALMARLVRLHIFDKPRSEETYKCRNANGFRIISSNVDVTVCTPWDKCKEREVYLAIPGTEVLSKAQYRAYVEAMRRIAEAIDRIAKEVRVEEEDVNTEEKLEGYVKRAARMWAESIVKYNLPMSIVAGAKLVKSIWSNTDFITMAAQGWDADDLRMEVTPWNHGHLVASIAAVAPNAKTAYIKIDRRDIPPDEYMRYAKMLIEKVEQPAMPPREERDTGPVVLVNPKYCCEYCHCKA